MKAVILTLSDRSARGERPDRSGPALQEWLQQRGVEVVAREILADEAEPLSARLATWADGGAVDLLLTTGGTGIAPRDVTPEATRSILERELPGFGEEMRRRSRQKTPHALISRALAGSRGRALIINLPGSPHAAVENLEAVWAAVPHTVGKLQGDPHDCAPGADKVD